VELAGTRRALEAVGAEARMEGFTAEGKTHMARLVVRLGGRVGAVKHSCT
jgi:hypothetical protein